MYRQLHLSNYLTQRFNNSFHVFCGRNTIAEFARVNSDKFIIYLCNNCRSLVGIVFSREYCTDGKVRPNIFGIFENSFDVDTFVAKPVNVYMFVHLVPKKVEALLDLSLTVGPPPP